MNEIGNKIDIELLLKGRRFNPQETLRQLNAGGKMKVWSWAAHNWTAYPDKDNQIFAFRFTVNAHHFRGHIYIVLNGADLYDVYYCSNRGNIKFIHNDIYNDTLTEVIDRKIEYISEYSQ